MSPEDVQQSSWLIARKIGKRRGYPIRFDDRDDQNLLCRWLQNEHVAYADKANRYARSLDAPGEDADGNALPANPALTRLLVASADMGPLQLLLAAEQAEESLAALRQSYSEATAYVWLLIRFRWSIEAIAADLRMTVVTLRLRMHRAGESLRWQPSLFDGRDVVDPDFQPACRRQYAKRKAYTSQTEQAVWRF